MRLDAPEEIHLTYCTNVHPGETWAETFASLKAHVPEVRRRVLAGDADGGAPFGVGLRLSAEAAEGLAAPGALAELRDFLADNALYVFTINGFPHGRFHGAPVKEGVYRPDWLEDERAAYTERLAGLLCALLPEGALGTLSTVPGAWKPRVGSPADEAAMAVRLVRVAAALHRLREERGRVVALALEPEPLCHLETVAETVAFFERRLFSRDARALFGQLAGLGPGAAEAALRAHLGVCFDACHMAVEHEEPAAALAAFDRAGIGVPKLQISAGLEVPGDGDVRAAMAALRRFADPVYLHQVVERGPGGLARHRDLAEALAAAEARGGIEGTWRVHFHVPLFREAFGPLRSTQAYAGEVLDLVRCRGLPAHLEVETYTWDVLPAEHRGEPVSEAIAREISWAKERLDR